MVSIALHADSPFGSIRLNLEDNKERVRCMYVSKQLTLDEAQRSINGISIPARPAVLLALQAELGKPDPNLRVIASRIASDVGLSAAVLKALNSPLFGLRSKCGSIPQAVQMLGLANVGNLVTGLALRRAVGAGQPSLERFWDSAEKVASISAYVTTILPGVSRDAAYTLGLFRDCAIPVLMQRFDDYRDTLKLAAGDDRSMTEVEDGRHGTNHATVGYMIGKTWCLPDTLCECILRHHDAEVFSEAEHQGRDMRTLISINWLAEHLNDAVLRMRGDTQWSSIGSLSLSHLGFSESDYAELKDDVVALLCQ